MQNEDHLWNTNWRLVQSINDLTEDIIKLKQKEQNFHKYQNEMDIQLEELKMKYYVALSDLNQERKKKERKKKWHHFFRKN